MHLQSCAALPPAALGISIYNKLPCKVLPADDLPSAASPTFAGIVSLLNSARLSEGRKPLGFLNPFIYKYGYKGLTDIVNGKSTGCTGTDIYSGLPSPFVPNAGWSAVRGWDPVTGYGTPNFPVLLALSQAQR